MQKIKCTECAAVIDGYVPFTAEDDDRLFCDQCWSIYEDHQTKYIEHGPSEIDEWASFDPDC